MPNRLLAKTRSVNFFSAFLIASLFHDAYYSPPFLDYSSLLKKLGFYIHPSSDEVEFMDVNSGYRFLNRFTKTSKEKVAWEDGRTYPVINGRNKLASILYRTPKIMGKRRQIRTIQEKILGVCKEAHHINGVLQRVDKPLHSLSGLCFGAHECQFAPLRCSTFLDFKGFLSR